LVLTEYEFASGVAQQVVKKSKYEVMNRQLQVFSRQIDCATHAVDTIEQQLCIETQ